MIFPRISLIWVCLKMVYRYTHPVMTIDWENNDRPLDLGVPYFQTNPYHSSKKDRSHSRSPGSPGDPPAGPHKRPPTEHPRTACRDRGPGPETAAVPRLSPGYPMSLLVPLPLPNDQVIAPPCSVHPVAHTQCMLCWSYPNVFSNGFFHAISNWNYGLNWC